MQSIEERIVRKGLEIGFSNVGFADVRDYPEWLEEARSRPEYESFAEGDESFFAHLSRTKTNNPWAKGVVCATLGYSQIAYPEKLRRSVARTYLSRCYSPQVGTVHEFQVQALADFLEELGMRLTMVSGYGRNTTKKGSEPRIKDTIRNMMSVTAYIGCLTIPYKYLPTGVSPRTNLSSAE